MFKRMMIISLVILSSLFLISCNKNTSTTNDNTTNEVVEDPKVRMYLSNGMTINLELYPKIAPRTVNNFLSLVDSAFYNGTIFHRIIDNFMIQGGGFYIENNALKAKDANKIVGEFNANGYTNNLLHEAGVLSMARGNDYNSASSQFFICSADSHHLDGNYAAFGRCADTESLNNVVALSKVKTIAISATFTDFPEDPITITKIERVTK